MTAHRAIVIHGHFYQPPRENPWLEAVEVQDSAAPYHDWNARITAECYAPNTAARRVDAANRIIDIVDNFERISFNIGPTLLAWLAREAPAVLAKIVEADRASVDARGGHGNAIAQVYNHMIMPLASRADKVTQVRWGLRGLPAALRAASRGHVAAGDRGRTTRRSRCWPRPGVTFTILAPSQARRVRRLGAEAWDEVGERVDPSRAYLWRGPRDLSLALFFYDGPISRAIAFEGLLESGERIVARFRAAFAETPHLAAAGALRDRRRVLRPPQPLRRDGAGRRAAHARGAIARSRSPTTGRSWPPIRRPTRRRSTQGTSW